MGVKNGECLICSAPLEYLQIQTEMECFYCHQIHKSNTRCINGHYICDSCHEKLGLYVIEDVCMNTSSRNPVAIMQEIIQSQHIHMHGPEHHVLAGSALLAAYHNAGGQLDRKACLEEMRNRASQVPGGVCGMWGACGAGISTGIYISLITGASPLSTEPWGMANEMTARSLEAIGRIGGPRCCKRGSYTAILQAIDFTSGKLGIQMEKPEQIRCGQYQKNNQCLGRRCPYHP